MKHTLAKRIITSLGIFMSLNAYADNSVFIDQTGDFNKVTINQDYNGNQIGGIGNGGPSNSNRAVINGSGNYINVDQIGAGNQLGLSVKNENSEVGATLTALASVTNINYQVYGTGNSGLIDVSSGGGANGRGNNVNIQQYGAGNQVGVQVGGNNNTIDFRTGTTGSGNGADNSVIQSTIAGSGNNQTVVFGGGNGNSATLQQAGDGNELSITASGASNAFTVSQDSSTGAAHTFSASVTGSSNSIASTQLGSSGSVVNMTVSGSSNSYTINSNTR